MGNVTTVCNMKLNVHLSAAAWIGMVSVLTCLLNPESSLAKPPLGKSWPASQQVAMQRIDHAPFDTLLKKYVDVDGYVDYATWYRHPTDRQALRDYLSTLSRASTTRPTRRDAQLAFWINAYNAVTLEGIMQEYPTTSIRDHTSRVFGYNIWKDLPLIVGSHQVSIEHIEHQILRKMNEPRIHFAIVCASVGCPRLRNEAYTADKLLHQLADNTTDFFSRPENFRLSGNTMYVNTVLSWFANDFGSSQVQRFTYLQPYLPATARAVAARPGTRVRYLEYDWGLNDQSKRRRGAVSKEGSPRSR